MIIQVAAHETCHLAGIKDRYTEKPVNGVMTTVPNPGYEDNMMGALAGTKLNAGQLLQEVYPRESTKKVKIDIPVIMPHL